MILLMMVTVGSIQNKNLYIYIYIYIYIRGEFNKFPDFFVQAFKNCRRLLKIHYVIAIHLMR